MPAPHRDVEPTPLAKLLLEYMWAQRPWPLQSGQLAYKIGVSKQSVSNWLHNRGMPSPPILGRISDVTGIPLTDLYAAAGYPVPAPPPPPQQYLPERQYTDDELFDRMIERTVATLRANGVTDEALLQAVVAQIRDVQHGTDRNRHVAAEFAPPAPERTVPSLPTIPAQPAQQPPSTPKRATSRSGEQQERRAPRRTSGRTRPESR